MEDLAIAGLYVDELQKLRVMDPEFANETQSLKNECGNFLEQTADFQRIADGLIALSDEVSKEVEREKLAALGARNQLKSFTKAREHQHQQLQAVMTEKRQELERLKVQLDSLKKVELEQQEFIERLTL